MYESSASVFSSHSKHIVDRHRPIYHFGMPEGVANPFDPNALIYYNGRYHLMLIVQIKRDNCWAHASSPDLVHWKIHPLALTPGGADRGIYSGGIFINHDGVPTVSYWGINFEPQPRVGVCLATSDDPDLIHWTKAPHNPVIQETEHGLTEGPDGTIYGAADPSAIWEKSGRYYMLTGNLTVLNKFGIKQKRPEHQGDTTYLFVSDDLVNWNYLHPFYQSDRKWTDADEDNMCPDFFPLGDRYMLLFISHNHGCQYYLGRYENDRFFPETHGRMSWIDRDFFAPESLLDHRGRRIMWAWIFDGRPKEVQLESGWSGHLSLPRVLWLGDDRNLRMGVPEELQALRRHPRHVKTPCLLTAGVDDLLQGISGDSLEIQAEFDLHHAERAGLVVRASPDGQEQTRVYYDVTLKKLCIDTTRSSLGPHGPKSIEAGPLELATGERLKLRVFIDKSVIEVFANDRQAVARTVYPTRLDSLSVAAFSTGNSAALLAMRAWEMAPLVYES